MVRNCCGGKNIGDGADVGRKRMAWWMGRGMWDVPTRPHAEPGQWKEIVWAVPPWWCGRLLGPYNLLNLVVRGRFEIWEPLVFDFLKRGKTDLQHGLTMTIFDQNDPYKWNPVFGKDKTATCDSLVVNSELQSCT
jgi:hypothetical protein